MLKQRQFTRLTCFLLVLHSPQWIIHFIRQSNLHIKFVIHSSYNFYFREDLVLKIMEFLDTDTLLYFAEHPENLVKMQNDKWGSIIKWTNDAYGLDLRATNNIMDVPQITEQCRNNVKRWLLSNNFWALHGIQYGTEAAKSITILMALIGARITAIEAADLARLEQIYQAQIWGNVCFIFWFFLKCKFGIFRLNGHTISNIKFFAHVYPLQHFFII